MLRPILILAAIAAAGAGAGAQISAAPSEPAVQAEPDPRQALAIARQQQRNALARSHRLDRQARAARAGSEAALVRLAALAAGIQQAEASVAEAEARHALARAQRLALETRLAAQRAPLARLVGAVETLSRRPTTLALFQRGSLTDLVHTRAVLDAAAPLVERRTRSLRAELAKVRALEGAADRALADRRTAQAALDGRRRDLTALAEAQRLTARRAAGDAGREAARAMALAEDARDLDTLVAEMADAGALRSRLAALPGPLPRPANPDRAIAAAQDPAPPPDAAAPSTPYQLPVDGRMAAGFGKATAASGDARPGISLVPRPRAQVVAPGSGRIAFAGAYKGYGYICIIEHGNGWTSLVTGLGNVDVAVGDRVTAGSPLGRAPSRRPAITLELRREGVAVNPLDQLR